MKKLLVITFTLICSSLFLFGCAGENSQKENTGDSDRIKIVATLFPQYDFAKIVGGDKVEVTKLLPGGVESHSYEPAPGDIVNINKSDMFLYTGDTMEPWAATVIDGVDTSSLMVVDVSENVPLLEDEEEDNHKEHYGADPHIWTDPTRAMIMVDNICNGLKKLDPENGEYYQNNADAYKKELAVLDEEINAIVENGIRDEIVFGGRFAFLYFTEHYDLSYDAAFDSCSESGEPSARKVAELIDEIKSEKIPVIYYEELSSTKVAESISKETGAELLLLHSCHNVTTEDLATGVTYLSLMQENAKNLEKGLN